MTSVHMFVRSLMSHVTMLDLDEYQGGVELLLQLRPSALVLGGDQRASRIAWQNRLPGSVNSKAGKKERCRYSCE